ncbi:MAG TPA: type II secretion system F family protein [Syntrophomonadaceae bacterium]|nr:type II secretion system F family protein [Syntrophomonadaceae bacterium]
MIYLAACSSSLLVFALVMLVGQAAFKDRGNIRGRLNSIKEMRLEEEDEPLSLPFRIRVLKPLEIKMVYFFVNLLPVNQKAWVEKKLVQAGNPKGMRAGVFMSGVMITLLIVTPTVFFIALILTLQLSKALVAALAGALLSILLPAAWLQIAAGSRIKEIDRSLPDAIDLLVVSVEAGLGFDLALAKISERMTGPLPEEFARVLQEMKLGKPREAALRDMSERVGSHNLSSFLAMVIQGTQMGISMAQILRVQSDTMRLVRRQKAEEMAMKAPIKMVFPLVFCVFPALLIILLGPAFLSIMESLNF